VSDGGRYRRACLRTEAADCEVAMVERCGNEIVIKAPRQRLAMGLILLLVSSVFCIPGLLAFPFVLVITNTFFSIIWGLFVLFSFFVFFMGVQLICNRNEPSLIVTARGLMSSRGLIGSRTLKEVGFEELDTFYVDPVEFLIGLKRKRHAPLCYLGRWTFQSPDECALVLQILEQRGVRYSPSLWDGLHGVSSASESWEHFWPRRAAAR
jgi:hypothetical protein